ncbi:hypothetical protein L7F22_018092 [Adiantum nelumboides]|nr:hypothetical protein [Adiantum nelumboides]
MTGVAPYKGPNAPLNGFPAIIWRANWLSPGYGETISLTLQEDGDLTLRGLTNDNVETVAWRSNTSGMGVTRMEFSQQPPNLILYDEGDSLVWQSSNYPTNTLMYGQHLEEGMTLVSYAWLDNVSEAEYSLEIDSTLHQLALFYKNYASSQKIPYWIWQLNGRSSPGDSCGPGIASCNAAKKRRATIFAAFLNSQGFSLGDPSNGGNYTTTQDLSYPIPDEDMQTTILQLDVDGSLRLLSIKETHVVLADLFSDDAACSLPQVCGTYGVCVGASKQCKCPNVDGPWVSSFSHSDPNNPLKGCTLDSPLPACTNTTEVPNAGSNSSTVSPHVQMQLVEGVTYFSTLQGSVGVISNVSSGDNCSTLCLLDCTCLAAVWRADFNVCSHIGEQQLGSFRGSMNSTLYKAYFKVSDVPNVTPSISPDVAPPGAVLSISRRPPLDTLIRQSTSRKIVIGVGVSTAALIVTSVSLFLLWCHKHWNARGRLNRFVLVNILGNASMLNLPPRYSYDELHTATKGFSHLLGKGGFGSVYAGLLPDGTTKVAVKKLEGMRQGEKEFRTELAIMGGIHHYNLLQLIGYCAEGAERRLLVYKYMKNGSLDQWLFASSGIATVMSLSKDEVDEQAMARMKWGLRHAIALDVAKGLAYLHEGCEKHIIHLDIKPQNILLDEGFVAKVADFGLSRGMDREESHVVTTMRGTPGYLAPEWMRDGTIDVKCDVYSFGMLLMEIVSGRKNLDMSRTEAPFYPEWAYSQLVSDKLLVQSNGNFTEPEPVQGESRDNRLHRIFPVEDLTDAKLESEQERAQVLHLITVAFLCVLERPEWRPPMSKVVQMLLGHVSLFHIDLSSLHQGLSFLLGSQKSSFSGSDGYARQAEGQRRRFQEQLESILALYSSSFVSTSSYEEFSQVSAR